MQRKLLGFLGGKQFHTQKATQLTVKKFFLIDTMAMAFRAYHALGRLPMSTQDGIPTGALFGSARFLLNILKEQRPEYIVAASDCAEPTFRHELFPAYKGNRGEMPEELAAQIPYLYEMIEAFQIPILKDPGVEADDIIGSLVRKFPEDDLHYYIVSGDKDFMQLINDKTFLYTPKKGEEAKIVGEAEVFEKFGCTPGQVIEALGLIGDSSDNVPGVPGIGPKSAAKLLQKHPNLEAIYKHLQALKNPKLISKLSENKENAFIARQLVTIKTDHPISQALDDFRYDSPDLSNLQSLFHRLEFKRLIHEIAPLNTSHPASSPIIHSEVQENHHYQLIQSEQDCLDLIQKLSKTKKFALDTETTGLDIIADRPIGISFSLEKGHAFYLPIHEKHSAHAAFFQEKIIDFLNQNTVKITGHNLKYDLQMLSHLGWAWRERPSKGLYEDSMLSSYLLNPSLKSHSLDRCVLENLQYRKIPTEELIGKKGEQQGSMLDVPLEKLTYYACEDADYSLRLQMKLFPQIVTEELTKVYLDIECPLVPVLAAMELNGVYIDKDQLTRLSSDLEKQGTILEKEIYGMAGYEFNILSPKQLQKIVIEELEIPKQLGIRSMKKTKTGYSMDVEVLEKLSEHPFPRMILEYRTISKLKSTYVDTFPHLIHPKTGRMHATFHQTGTATGRLSSSDPNLQNIPIRSEMGKKIRAAFVAENPQKNVILAADYSQVELRILANLAQDEHLLEAFRLGRDIHKETACRIFDKTPETVTADERSKAKAINFGILYGMGPQRLARENKVSVAEAKQFIERYFEQFPKIKSFIDSTIDAARQTGYSRTVCGRKRFIPNLDSDQPLLRRAAENMAINSPIQGSASDLIKLAMVSLYDQGFSHDILIQVHDELLFEISKDHLADAKKQIQELMESAFPLDVPLKVSIGYGDSWLEAH